jgi:hypothetical protein
MLCKGPESDMFIVTKLLVASDDSNRGNEQQQESQQSVIVSLTARCLLEKDINGDLLDKLDLRCLTDVKVDNDGDPDNNQAVVRLAFSYRRRDRRERHYVMENATAAQVRVFFIPMDFVDV